MTSQRFKSHLLNKMRLLKTNQVVTPAQVLAENPAHPHNLQTNKKPKNPKYNQNNNKKTVGNNKIPHSMKTMIDSKNNKTSTKKNNKNPPEVAINSMIKTLLKTLIRNLKLDKMRINSMMKMKPGKDIEVNHRVGEEDEVEEEDLEIEEGLEREEEVEVGGEVLGIGIKEEDVEVEEDLETEIKGEAVAVEEDLETEIKGVEEAVGDSEVEEVVVVLVIMIVLKEILEEEITIIKKDLKVINHLLINIKTKETTTW